MDWSLPGTSVHEDSPGKKTTLDSYLLLQRIVPIQGLNLGLLHCRRILYYLSHQGSPYVIFKIYSLNMFHVYKALLLITVSTLYLGSSEWINLKAGSFYPSAKISPFPQSPASGNYFLFFFPNQGFLWFYLFLAVLGLLCCMAFSSCSKQELFCMYSSHCGGFSWCGARAFSAWASVVAAWDSVVAVLRL